MLLDIRPLSIINKELGRKKKHYFRAQIILLHVKGLFLYTANDLFSTFWVKEENCCPNMFNAIKERHMIGRNAENLDFYWLLELW